MYVDDSDEKCNNSTTLNNKKKTCEFKISALSSCTYLYHTQKRSTFNSGNNSMRQKKFLNLEFDSNTLVLSQYQHLEKVV